MSSDDVRFDVIEGQVEPDQPQNRESGEERAAPPVAPVIAQETLTRSLRRWRQRQQRLRAD